MSSRPRGTVCWPSGSGISLHRASWSAPPASAGFLGLQPLETAAQATRTGVELDTLSARLLNALYPRAMVHALGFQDAPLRDDFFDVAISNVPFGDVPVADRAFLKPGQRYLARAVHNYFFVKAL